jgi:hypothetical protein
MQFECCREKEWKEMQALNDLAWAQSHMAKGGKRAVQVKSKQGEADLVSRSSDEKSKTQMQKLISHTPVSTVAC